MRMLDLFCGRGGWTNGFLERGWECIGVDIVRHPDYRGTFVQANVLNISMGPEGRICIHASDPLLFAFKFDFICASSPCENFSIHRLKNFHPNPPYPELGIRLFNHTRTICELSGKPYVMENVQSAEPFVGRARAHAGSFYLWGTGVPTLLPKGLTKGMKMDRKWCQELGGHGSSRRDAQTAGFATIPPELAGCVADYAERIVAVAV